MNFRIKEAREKANIDQKCLAGMLGIAPSTLSGYESGTHDPKSDKLSQIADICGVTTDYLLGRNINISQNIKNDDNEKIITPSMERLAAVVDKLTPEQACFMVQLVEHLLRLNPDAYAAARAENRRLWEGD